MTATSDVRVFVFESSHLALWAEDVARERSVPVKVVAAPAGTSATCGLALEIPASEAASLEAAFTDEGIAFSLR
ncbi:MAG: DUF3343 domain-containing protein [Gemmatimonadales bacterium]|nr:MAG: DUF3343 domain-containing protein [Gemmatimonadales bacterium]